MKTELPIEIQRNILRAALVKITQMNCESKSEIVSMVAEIREIARSAVPDYIALARTAKLKNKCNRCGGAMAPGQALQQTFTSGSPDFPGDSVGMTISVGGSGKLVDVLKCKDCGYSFTI